MPKKPKSAQGKFCNWKALFRIGGKTIIVENIGAYTEEQAFDVAHRDGVIPAEVREEIRESPYGPGYSCEIQYQSIA